MAVRIMRPRSAAIMPIAMSASTMVEMPPAYSMDMAVDAWRGRGSGAWFDDDTEIAESCPDVCVRSGVLVREEDVPGVKESWLEKDSRSNPIPRRRCHV